MSFLVFNNPPLCTRHVSSTTALEARHVSSTTALEAPSTSTVNPVFARCPTPDLTPVSHCRQENWGGQGGGKGGGSVCVSTRVVCLY